MVRAGDVALPVGPVLAVGEVGALAREEVAAAGNGVTVLGQRAVDEERLPVELEPDGDRRRDREREHAVLRDLDLGRLPRRDRQPVVRLRRRHRRARVADGDPLQRGRGRAGVRTQTSRLTRQRSSWPASPAATRSTTTLPPTKGSTPITESGSASARAAAEVGRAAIAAAGDRGEGDAVHAHETAATDAVFRRLQSGNERPLRRRARPALPRDGRRGRLPVAERRADPDPHHDRAAQRRAAAEAADLRRGRRPLRRRRVEGRREAPSGLVPEPRAEPDVHVQVKADRFPARARTAEGDERERLWERMAEIWPAYDDYRQKTDREIPVVLERA